MIDQIEYEIQIYIVSLKKVKIWTNDPRPHCIKLVGCK